MLALLRAQQRAWKIKSKAERLEDLNKWHLLRTGDGGYQTDLDYPSHTVSTPTGDTGGLLDGGRTRFLRVEFCCACDSVPSQLRRELDAILGELFVDLRNEPL